MADFYPLTVRDIGRETQGSVVVSLAVPDRLAGQFKFIQGQYLTFRARIQGVEVRRSYSICAGVDEPLLSVGIKKAPGGVFSTWANEVLQVGQELDAMPPMGNFHTPLDRAQRRHYAGFAAGSGITPLLSIIKTTLVKEPLSSFSLVFGNRTSGSIMFREELEALKNEHMEHFSLTHILSREEQDVELFNGRIDKEKCRKLFHYWLDVATLDAAFVCGPQPMMVAVAEALGEQGLDRRQIKFELFTNSEAARKQPSSRTEVSTRADSCQVTVILDGRARSFALQKDALTVLDAALEEGIEAPYACKSGVCSTCRALVVEGQVSMDANYALDEYETARGYVLTCQSHPVTDRVVVDYDQ